MEDRGELHKYFLWLDALAETHRDQIELLLVQLLPISVELLNEFLHDLSKVSLVLPGQHAHQIYL